MLREPPRGAQKSSRVARFAFKKRCSSGLTENATCSVSAVLRSPPLVNGSGFVEKIRANKTH